MFYQGREGSTFEQVIKDREIDNDDYSFLHTTPWNEQAIYYRWKVYLIATSFDTKEPKSWPNAPFQISTDGPYYMPPPCFEASQKNESSSKNIEKVEAKRIMTGAQIAKARESER